MDQLAGMIRCTVRRHDGTIIKEKKLSADCNRGEGITIDDMISHEELRKVCIIL